MKIIQTLKNRKGFTLMELIIVMVILALLAAAVLPSFINFVRDARESSLLAEARLGHVAAQVVLTESAGSTTALEAAQTQLRIAPMENTRFFGLIENDVPAGGIFSNILSNSVGRVTELTYSRGGRTVTIDDDGIVRPDAP